MIELRDGAGFAVEPLAKLRVAGEDVRQDFDRDGAIEARIARLVDFAHAAGAKGGEHFVRTKASAGLNCHD